MNIQYKIKGAEINDTDKDYASKKAQSLLKYINADKDNIRFDIEFSEDAKHVSGEVYRVDMVAIAPGLDMHAVGHGETMQAAIDMARDDLARRLRRKKRKDISMLRKGGRMIKKMLRRSK